VNAAPGAVVTMRGRPFAVMSFIVADGRIIEIDTIADPERVRGSPGLSSPPSKRICPQPMPADSAITLGLKAGDIKRSQENFPFIIPAGN
jgi:hypothetical protein